MQETDKTSEILTALRAIQPDWVGIDGMDGSGKSTLASLLSKELGWSRIDLDDYIEEGMGGYVEHIHYDEVRNILARTKGPIIIEGVCLLAALERLGRHPELLIYIKKMAPYGMWYDEEDCTVSGDIDDFIEGKKGQLKKFVEADAHMNGEEPPTDLSFPELDEEIIRYHYMYKPHEKADILYERIG